jgi:hypothetical protein
VDKEGVDRGEGVDKEGVDRALVDRYAGLEGERMRELLSSIAKILLKKGVKSTDAKEIDRKGRPSKESKDSKALDEEEWEKCDGAGDADDREGSEFNAKEWSK